MDKPIMLTPQELAGIMLALCAAVMTISGAATVIANVVKKAREPDARQNERISKLETDVVQINERLEKGNVRFQASAERMDRLEENMRETNKVIIEGLQALTAHAIDGNNTEELKTAKHALDEYLVNRI